MIVLASHNYTLSRVVINCIMYSYGSQTTTNAYTITCSLIKTQLASGRLQSLHVYTGSTVYKVVQNSNINKLNSLVNTFCTEQVSIICGHYDRHGQWIVTVHLAGVLELDVIVGGQTCFLSGSLVPSRQMQLSTKFPL